MLLSHDEYYNVSYKEFFLDRSLTESTKDTYRRIFMKSAPLEFHKNKDLYEFTEEELHDFMSNHLKVTTKESARTYYSVLISYIQLAMNKGLSKHLTNPIRRNQEFLYSFVDQARFFLSWEEKNNILVGLMNRQDQFLIQALWEGMEGKKLSELVNLQIHDINQELQSISIKDEDGNVVRRLEYVDELTIHLAHSAYEENSYIKNNGRNEDRKESVQLVDSDYIIRSAKTNNHRNVGKASHYTLYNRLEMMQKAFEDYKPALSPKNIKRSGMLHMAKRLYQRDGILGVSQIKEICHRYNMKDKYALRDFLNTDVIHELYGVTL